MHLWTSNRIQKQATTNVAWVTFSTDTCLIRMLACVYSYHVMVKSICDWILETDQIVMLGLFQFIGPADSYTHTVHVHCCIDRPS